MLSRHAVKSLSGPAADCQVVMHWNSMHWDCMLGPISFSFSCLRSPIAGIVQISEGLLAIDGKLLRWRPISCGVAYNDLEWHQSPVSDRTYGSMLALADLLVSNHELVSLSPSESRRQGFCTSSVEIRVGLAPVLVGR